jgi:hypothetical protein
MAFQTILRRTTAPAAPPVCILILASNPEAAVDMGMRVRELGFVAIEPRVDERAHAAIARLRPSVVMVQTGREELRCPGLGISIREISARFIIFGKEWPDVVDVARRHSALSLPMQAPAKMIRSAIRHGAPA